ncbi:MAG: BlaI/MecI/CopY family transcriptional regulator [Candidatus Dormibacteria bacterium]
MARPRLIDKAMALLGPLEARIMQLVWDDQLPAPFIVRDVHAKLPELAYTTLMTTVHRLADKGLLNATQLQGVRAHQYRQELSPKQYLQEQGGREIDELIARYGDAAFVAFAARLEEISPERRERLRKLAGQ